MNPGDLVLLEEKSGIDGADIPVYTLSRRYQPSGRETTLQLENNLEAMRYMSSGSVGVLMSLHPRREGEGPHWGGVFLENSVFYVWVHHLAPVRPV